MSTEFRSFGFSDAGRHHRQNEDAYLCNEEERLFLVADGMGGQASGETASRLAIRHVEEFVAQSRSGAVKLPTRARSGLTAEQNRLLTAALFANRRIFDAASQDPAFEGMGTTLVGATIEGDHLSIVNVGDSRLYLVREGGIAQLTEDHSFVGEQTRRGALTREEARKHPQRHILTRALGISPKAKIDVFLTEIMPKDMYLMCSDGLSTMLEDREILSIITGIEDRSLYKIGLSLALKANLAGGMDNITVVLISFE